MAINKVIYDGTTLIDLTSDTVEADKLLTGYTAHDMSGSTITGTCDYDSDTSDATATAAEMLSGVTAYARATKITGTMTNNGAVTGTISEKADVYIIPSGYHDGSGTVQIDSTEQSKIIADNIREGITILGVTGTMSGTEDVVAETVTVTPSSASQIITPSDGYNYIAQVTVNAIPYTETTNSAGGTTVTIG